MSVNIQKIGILLWLVLLAHAQVNAQYKYTRYSFDLNAGMSYPNTSIKGTFGGYGELGFRLATSKYLSGRMAFGVGNLKGSQEVTGNVGRYDNVKNYSEYNATYYYFCGSAALNLERVFNLRAASRTFSRLNMFLVVGAGYMYPDVKVYRPNGSSKNYTYKNDVRFIHNNFGLDFKYFLSNRFDLNFGAEYRLVQTYYLDGAYADKAFDGLANGYVGIAYNIGANADRKHLEWFNLDGKIDVIYVPFKDEPKKDVPVVDQDQRIKDSLAMIEVHENEVTDLYDKESPVVTDTTSSDVAVKIPDAVVKQPVDTFKKVGRHTDIRVTQQPKQDTIAKTVVVKQPTKPVNTANTLNDIKGVVQPLGKYNVIVGTYAGSKYAYAFRDKLRKQGFQAALFKDNDRSKMVRVAVYFGDDRVAANRELRRYLAKFNQQAWLHIYKKQ